MICAIHQPQFLPWLGQFQKIRRANVFVFLDTVQYQKHEFQNRNRIRTAAGVRWLTVPVRLRFGDAIRDVAIADDLPWRRKLWGTLEHTYGRVPGFATFGPQAQALLESPCTRLAEINMASVHWLMDAFAIDTRTVLASEMPVASEDRTGRLVDICLALGADTYLSGSLARRYLDLAQFERHGIRVDFQDYQHPVYTQHQCMGEFQSHLSALDALFNCGGGANAREALGL